MLENNPRIKPIPRYGHIFTMEDFLDCVNCGGFIDYDGFGYYATKNVCIEKPIYPSDVKAGDFDASFSHIIWFNR
jgi:hypothetical protein